MNYVNPFDSELALQHSSYWASRMGYLVNLLDPQKTASELAEFVHGQFYALMMDVRFSCVAGRSAFNQKTYRFGMYPELTSAEATAGLCRDLYAFVQEQAEMNSNFTTFVASFAGPNPVDEEHFENLLWQQLQRLHEHDTSEWDAAVSSDPEDRHFSFSFAGRSFFIVGLHAGSSRWARRFAWPTLVFNAHHQFEHLRKTGKYAQFQRTIRGAERRLQGSINPSLMSFGEKSEAAQYSGRAVEENWKCPFTAREKSEAQSNGQRNGQSGPSNGQGEGQSDGQSERQGDRQGDGQSDVQRAARRVSQLVVHEDAFELGIINPVACVIEGVKVLAGSGALDHEVETLMRELSGEAENILARSEVKAFNELFERMGYPRQKPAGQRLIELLLRNGFKRYNNIVDAYNIASVQFGSGLGLHDVRRIKENDASVQVLRARGEEKIIPLFKKEPVSVVRGDLIYGIATAPDMSLLAWLGKRDVDSDEFKVSDDTDGLLLVALGNAATSEAYNRAACQKTFELINQTCPDARITYLETVFKRTSPAAGNAEGEAARV